MSVFNLKQVVLKFERKTKGEKKLDLSAFFLAQVYAPLFSMELSVPSVVENNLVVFDIEKEIVKLNEFKDVGVKELAHVLSVYVQASGRLADVDEKKLASELNLSVEKTRKILKEVEIQLVNKSGVRSVASILVKDVLQESEKLEALKGSRNVSDIFEGIQAAQQLYSAFTMSQSTAAIGGHFKNAMIPNAAIGMIYNLYKLFNNPYGASSKAKASHVMDSLSKYLNGSEMARLKAIIPGIAYSLEDISMFAECDWADVLAAHLLTIRMIEGMAPDTSMTEAKLSNLVDELFLGQGDLAMYIPAGYITPNPKKSTDLLSSLWTFFASLRCASGNYGATLGRYETVMDSRKYKRNDEYDQVIQEAIIVGSIMMDAFYDASSFLKALIQDQSIHVPKPDPITRKKLTEFHFKQMGRYAASTIQYTHPRALMDPAYMLNHSFSEVLSGPTGNLEPVYTDEDRSAAFSSSDRVNGTFWKSLRGEIISGNLFTLGAELQLRALFGRTPVREAHYCMTLPQTSILADYDVFKTLYAVPTVADIRQATSFFEELSAMGEYLYIASAEEMAQKLGLPMDVATKRFKKSGPEIYLSFTKMKDVKIFVPGALCPVYEVAGGLEHRRIPPFVSTFPAYAEAVVEASDATDLTIFDAAGTVSKIDLTLQKNKELTEVVAEKDKIIETMKEDLAKARK